MRNRPSGDQRRLGALGRKERKLGPVGGAGQGARAMELQARDREWGTWGPGPAHQPCDPSTEQRGADESVDPSPAARLLPGTRLLVRLRLLSSVQVSRGSRTSPPGGTVP